MQIGTPLSPNATRVMLLGSGELGKEVIIALQRLGVEVIAVDRYKNAPGHQVAHRAHVIDMTNDQALRDLAHAVQQVAAAPDLVCRVGGDEFVILSLDRSVGETMRFAQQLLHCGRQALQPYATADSVPTLSIGIAHFTVHDSSMEDIMRRVDQALYISKTQGGHQVSAAESGVE